MIARHSRHTRQARAPTPSRYVRVSQAIVLVCSSLLSFRLSLPSSSSHSVLRVCEVWNASFLGRCFHVHGFQRRNPGWPRRFVLVFASRSLRTRLDPSILDGMGGALTTRVYMHACAVIRPIVLFPALQSGHETSYFRNHTNFVFCIFAPKIVRCYSNERTLTCFECCFCHSDHQEDGRAHQKARAPNHHRSSLGVDLGCANVI